MSKELSPEERIKKIQQLAARLLHRREHSARELELKILQRGFELSEIKPVLATLQDKKWQSDERFLESFIHSRISRGYGELRVKAELQQKGINAAEVDAAFTKLEVDWQALAAEVYLRKYSTAPKDAKEMQKRQRFMLQRGFSANQIKSLIDSPEDDYNL